MTDWNSGWRREVKKAAIIGAVVFVGGFALSAYMTWHNRAGGPLDKAEKVELVAAESVLPALPEVTPDILSCPCAAGGIYCIGPKGGRYCVTDTGKKKYSPK